MSGAEVIGGISAVIGIIEASVKIYNNARKDIKLSETFKIVGCRLPIILDTLRSCKRHLEPVQDSIPTDAREALKEIIKACDQKARKLREIYGKVIPGEKDTWEKRYRKIIKRLGNGNKVEELMASVTHDVQLVVNHHAVKSAQPETNIELENIIKEMKSLKSSVPEEESSGMTFNSGGGAMEAYISRDDGHMIINRERIKSQNFNYVVKQKENYSFRKPVGVCLGQAPSIESELFIGRDSELNQMEKALRPVDEPREQRKLLVGGIGGIGKTQLAIAYAKHPNIYTSVFWLNASSDAAIKDSFRSIAEQIFDIHALRALEMEQIIICVHQWLSDTENRHWLLIFDGYDNPSVFKIESYYPPASHGDIVVTTRRPDSLNGMVIQVQPLQDVEESLRILETRSKRENSQSDYHAKRLADRFAGLPLALATAGAFLHHSSFTFERYLKEYEKRWNIDPRRPLQLQEYQDRTLYTTWDLSYTLLEREDPDAAKLLRLLAYFSNQSVWYELLHAGFTEDSPKWLHQMIEDEVIFDSVMRVLTDYSFLEVKASLKSWSMHRCVHDWTLAVLNKDIDLQQYWYAFDCIAESISKDGWEFDDFRHLSYSRLAAHATRLVLLHQHNNILYSMTPHYLKKVADIAGLLKDQVQLKPAEEMYQRALAGYEKALGPDHTSTLDTVNDLGILYFEQGKLKEAEEMFQLALAGLEKALGPDHTSTLATVNNLGLLYSDQGKLKEAEEMYQRALAGREKKLGPDHISTLATVNNLGLLYRNQGKLRTAEEMYQRALAGHEKILGPDHTSTLATVNNLGFLYRNQDKLKYAE
ncbi:hypothetical protein CBS133816_9241 [Aspergillus niger]|nr:hypothetical protein CBS133816_9241 [Aspergillus niger]